MHILAREACWQEIADRVNSCEEESEKIRLLVYKITMPNAELFAINSNRVMMISKYINNVQPALFYNLDTLNTPYVRNGSHMFSTAVR